MAYNLILLTRRFPFFYTESFLESEIPFLSKVFDKIVIYPSEITNFKRQTPENVFIDVSFSATFKRKGIRFIRTLFSRYFWNLVLENRKTSKVFFQLFIFSSGVLAYSKFIEKNKKLFENCMVYSYWLNEAPMAFLKVKEKNKLNSLLVSRAHRYDIYEDDGDSFPSIPSRKTLLERIDKVFVISQNGKDYLENKYNCNDNITLAKLGVFDNQTLTSESTKGKFHIISVSRVEPVKRVDFIFESIKELATKSKDLQIFWTHFGNGSKYNDLFLKIKNINSDNLVIELKGTVNNAQIYEFYKEVDIDCFINLSLSEGIPVSIMEAQSFGIPVIATNVGGTSEIVIGETGILLSSDPKIEEVVDAFHSIITNKPDRKAIKEYWNNNFNADINYSKFAKDLIDLYDSRLIKT